MNSALRKIILCVLPAMLLLCSCTAVQGTSGAQLGSKPTVDDIFTAPVTTAPTVPGVTEPVGTTESTKPSQSIDGGMTGIGIVGEYQEDEIGRYRVYDGGEMYLSIKLTATGASAIEYTEQGIGFLLYVDGRAQPYRVGEDGALGYCHVLYPEFDPQTCRYYFDVYFTPVAGKQGEMVEVYITNITKPNWQTSDPLTAWRHTFGTTHVGTRVKMNVTPPELERPAVKERIQSVEIAHEDAKYEEIGRWTDEELITKIMHAWYIDGKYPKLGNGFMYEWTAKDSVELQFVVWGTPDVCYGLMFYIDNQPISAQQAILFDMEPGKKTVITVNIDLSDFDGECVIYAALIARNRLTTPVRTQASLHLAKTYYLLDDPEPVT